MSGLDDWFAGLGQSPDPAGEGSASRPAPEPATTMPPQQNRASEPRAVFLRPVAPWQRAKAEQIGQRFTAHLPAIAASYGTDPAGLLEVVAGSLDADSPSARAAHDWLKSHVHRPAAPPVAALLALCTAVSAVIGESPTAAARRRQRVGNRAAAGAAALLASWLAELGPALCSEVMARCSDHSAELAGLRPPGQSCATCAHRRPLLDDGIGCTLVWIPRQGSASGRALAAPREPNACPTWRASGEQ